MSHPLLLFRRLDNNPAAWLTPTLNRVVMNSLGGDATELYEALFGSSEYIACLEEMFYHGLLDDEFDTFCATLNIMMYSMLVFVATLMVCAIRSDDTHSPTLALIPLIFFSLDTGRAVPREYDLRLSPPQDLL